MLNAIQEVCKEKVILKREYMNGLGLPSYIASKFINLGFLCLLQSVVMVTLFTILVEVRSAGLLYDSSSYIEYLITTFLTTLSAAGLGIMISSIFKNSDRVMAIAPILLIPQILFSGALFMFDSDTILEYVSYFITCRWATDAFGTTANLNGMQLAIHSPGFFTQTTEHLLTAWGILLGSALVFAILSIFFLRKEMRVK